MTRSRNIAASKAVRLQDKADRLAVEGKYAKSELLSSKADSLWHLIRTTGSLKMSAHLSLADDIHKPVSSQIPRPTVATAYIPGMSQAFNASLSRMVEGAQGLESLPKTTTITTVVPDLDNHVFVLPHR